MMNDLQFQRVFVIVCDSMGIGQAEDAALFGDEGANTIGHICEVMGGLNVMNMEGLGLGSLGDFKGIPPLPRGLGITAALKEVSAGKDTMTGHWEMMGLKTEEPFLVFTDTGFPQEFISLFEEKTGRKCIGNMAASGTEILDELGERQIETGEWIVYTSADSVFQIAANEDVIPLQELYDACALARELLMKPEWRVGRVIARPYVGKKKGAFTRTPHRRDYALTPPKDTLLDMMKEHGLDVIGVGKIHDIFNGKGLTDSYHTDDNADGMTRISSLCEEGGQKGLIFANLVDFDAVYGHRRNTVGYGKAIEAFDSWLGTFMAQMKDTDLLMITADHGNDPTWRGTDHTREHVPLLMYHKNIVEPGCLGVLESYGVIGATIAENFGVPYSGVGTSLFKKLISVK